MGCGWNPVCHTKKAASKAWDWLTGDGPAGWIRAILVLIIIFAAIAIVVFLIPALTLWVQVAMVVLAVAFFFLVVYGIATKKSTKP